MITPRGWVGLLLVLALTACSNTDTRAIRHLVIAEFIEREHLPESYIGIKEIRFDAPEKATAIVKVFSQGGRADSWRMFRCELERDGGRWVIRRVSPELHG